MNTQATGGTDITDYCPEANPKDSFLILKLRRKSRSGEFAIRQRRETNLKF